MSAYQGKYSAMGQGCAARATVSACSEALRGRTSPQFVRVFGTNWYGETPNFMASVGSGPRPQQAECLGLSPLAVYGVPRRERCRLPVPPQGMAAPKSY